MIGIESKYGYIRFRPNLGFGISYKKYRVRVSRYHGIQLLSWRNNGWRKVWPSRQSPLEKQTNEQIKAGKGIFIFGARPPEE